MRRFRFHRSRILIVALYGLAALLMPLAHHPLDLGTKADLSVFALPDGTIPVLCSSVAGKSGQPGSVTHVVCDACLLTSAPGLLAAPFVIAPPTIVQVRLARTFETRAPARPSRQRAGRARLLPLSPELINEPDRSSAACS